MEVINRSRITGDALDIIRDLVSSCRSFEQLSRFAHNQMPGFEVAGSVAYEDHTHDVLVSRSSGSQVLVFSTTCKGDVLGAAIYDKRPSESELRETRRRLTPPEGRPSPFAANPHYPPAPSDCRLGGHRSPRLRA